MTARVIDGKALAQRVREGLASDIACVVKARGTPPGLAVVLVGDDPASAVYVRNKETAAHAIGMFSEINRRPASTGQAELEDIIRELERSSGHRWVSRSVAATEGVSTWRR